MTAEILQFIAADAPSLDCYEVPRELQKALFQSDLTGTQHAVMQALIFLTYGHKREAVETTAARLAGLMCRDAKVISKALKTLKINGLIEHGSGVYAVNENPEGWKVGGRSESAKSRAKQAVKARESKRSNQPAGSNEKGNLQVTPEKEIQPTGSTQGEGLQVEKEPVDRCLYMSNTDTKEINNKNPDSITVPDGTVRTPSKAVSTAVSQALAVAQKRHPEAVVATRQGKAVFWGSQADAETAGRIHAMVSAVTMAEAPTDHLIARWSNDVRLTADWLTKAHGITSDRTHPMIEALFHWANNHDFWRQNILCPKTLRKQWSKVAAQYAQEKQRNQSSRVSPAKSTARGSDNWGDDLNDY